MSVSEWSLPIERGGIKSTVGEYSISAVGPGPRATLHWGDAKRRGLKTVAKVALNNTLGTFGCAVFARARLGGRALRATGEGGRRRHDVELEPGRLSVAQPGTGQHVCRATGAGSVVGTGSTRSSAISAHVQRPMFAKRGRSSVGAFREYPYDGGVLYNAPQQMGPANLLYGQSTGYSATMVGFPYDDLTRWRGPYPPKVFAEQFQKVADGWAEGLTELKAAQAFVPAELQLAAAADLRVAQAAHLHFASVANQVRFVMARDALIAAQDDAARDNLRQELNTILNHEIELARRMFELSSADSRLGYEASNHYYYVPLDLVEKVINCEDLKTRFVAHNAGQDQAQ